VKSKKSAGQPKGRPRGRPKKSAALLNSAH
jgi:hypothetical protein